MPKKPRKPSMGRIVIYRDRSGVDMPAIIRRVAAGDTCDLTVFTDSRELHAREVWQTDPAPERAPGVKPNSWRWPVID